MILICVSCGCISGSGDDSVSDINCNKSLHISVSRVHGAIQLFTRSLDKLRMYFMFNSLGTKQTNMSVRREKVNFSEVNILCLQCGARLFILCCMSTRYFQVTEG